MCPNLRGSPNLLRTSLENSNLVNLWFVKNGYARKVGQIENTQFKQSVLNQ
jgi:hypothetical protein